MAGETRLLTWQVKAAYKAQALKWHPDKHEGEGDEARAEAEAR